jgi:type III pantothenate kinase
MILLDCGNSQVKAQYHHGGRLQASFSCAYRVGDWNARLTHWFDDLACAGVYLCSVLDPARQAQLDSCLAARFGAAVTRFRSEAQALGVTNGYREPGRLGADRWMALLAAAAMVQTDCIVIDAGSAITVDLLRADGQHLGGAILPGFNTSNDSFRRIFGHIDFDHPEIAETTLPGCSTEAAIQIDYGHHSIDTLPALVNRWIPLLDENPALLLAGGDAPRVQGLIERPARIVPDLVFRGMRRLTER